MSAPKAFTFSGSIALTVAAVPTGINEGVLIDPRVNFNSPTLALPSLPLILKFIANLLRIIIVKVKGYKMEEFKNNNSYTTDDNENQIENISLIKPSTTDHPLYDNVVEACKTVFDPEIPVNIYDLGLIYTIEINDNGDAMILMSLTAPGCPVAEDMPGWVSDAVKPVNGINSVNVEIVWEPQWGMDMMSDEARLELGFM